MTIEEIKNKINSSEYDFLRKKPLGNNIILLGLGGSYAYGTNTPVVVVQLGEDSNLMVHEGCHSNITLEELKTYDFEMLPAKPYKGKMF